jgi:xylulose-5-phosphate/fructose-6-phosphate phosphoketolase
VRCSCLSGGVLPDANCLVSTSEHCLQTSIYVNLISLSKRSLPPWLFLAEAIVRCRVGGSAWTCAST